MHRYSRYVDKIPRDYPSEIIPFEKNMVMYIFIYFRETCEETNFINIGMKNRYNDASYTKEMWIRVNFKTRTFFFFSDDEYGQRKSFPFFFSSFRPHLW